MYPYYLQSEYILCMFIWAHLHTHQIDRVYDWSHLSSGRGVKVGKQCVKKITAAHQLFFSSFFFTLLYLYDIIIRYIGN